MEGFEVEEQANETSRNILEQMVVKRETSKKIMRLKKKDDELVNLLGNVLKDGDNKFRISGLPRPLSVGNFTKPR